MELTITSLIFNGLLGIAMYFMRSAHENTKDEIKDLKKSVETVKDTYYKKEDFREFKEELWKKFDRLEEQLARKE